MISKKLQNHVNVAKLFDLCAPTFGLYVRNCFIFCPILPFSEVRKTGSDILKVWMDTVPSE